MIEDEATWKSTFNDLPKVSDSSWKQNFANWIAARTDGKLVLATYSPSPSFTFNSATFQNNLSETINTGLASLVAAWNSSIAASTMAVTPPTYFTPQTPQSTFSTVISVLPDPASIAVGASIIAELALAQPTTDSLFPVKFRNAFLSLTYTVTGTDSSAPTPIALVDPIRGVQ